MSETIAVTETDQREVLVFTLGGEEYAVDILKVQEIRGYSNVTRIANVPEFIKGVTNLRGEIVPIVDLRIKFALGEADYTEHTVVIVLNIGERVVGIVVDSVSDVIGLSAEQIKPAPEFGGQMNTAYLQGLASIEERMLILIDVEAMMTSREMALVDTLDAATA
ncbi:MAG: chemotaxis protein CheW [Salinisphaera sp.]|uniref:chemotaxis protein CheW n=1 Tax=Salinisphaera sp. TaxID=1914330 RepID=UPI003C7E270B